MGSDHYLPNGKQTVASPKGAPIGKSRAPVSLETNKVLEILVSRVDTFGYRNLPNGSRAIRETMILQVSKAYLADSPTLYAVLNLEC